MRYKKTGGALILTTLVVSLIFTASLPIPAAVTPPDVSPPQTAAPPTAEETPEPGSQEAAPDDPPPDVIPHAPENREPQASGHFRMSEYACDCGGYCDGWPAQMSPELLERIEALRCQLNRPVIITSGVRCPERNAEVGGIPHSWHLSGHAADLYCPGVSVATLAETAENCGLGVLPYYESGYVHVELWE
ncbi:D-Ala-D-Ala carboxypeptidase family metallohydrolase [Eubacterium sp. 1001713B170207_170306_E7]|uniref:YcbK family protein n=1 Tax=Eubacterium sp. 1001713B170207_170306_E7 TaxID=2787097 RepID=UPI00189C2468|nr:D-Ala-D-Ala carboxypeptidase family metallohydrolase [Eubacterium sp. 1001713B170207_170306_E7]